MTNMRADTLKGVTSIHSRFTIPPPAALGCVWHFRTRAMCEEHFLQLGKSKWPEAPLIYTFLNLHRD